MVHMRAPALVLFAALLAGCGGEPQHPAPGEPTPAAPAPSAEAALPVTAPMQARDRLLHDLEKQSRQARDRAAALEQVIGGGR